MPKQQSAAQQCHGNGANTDYESDVDHNDSDVFEVKIFTKVGDTDLVEEVEQIRLAFKGTQTALEGRTEIFYGNSASKVGDTDLEVIRQGLQATQRADEAD